MPICRDEIASYELGGCGSGVPGCSGSGVRGTSCPVVHEGRGAPAARTVNNARPQLPFFFLPPSSFVVVYAYLPHLFVLLHLPHHLPSTSSSSSPHPFSPHHLPPCTRCDFMHLTCIDSRLSPSPQRDATNRAIFQVSFTSRTWTHSDPANTHRASSTYLPTDRSTGNAKTRTRGLNIIIVPGEHGERISLDSGRVTPGAGRVRPLGRQLAPGWGPRHSDAPSCYLLTHSLSGDADEMNGPQVFPSNPPGHATSTGKSRIGTWGLGNTLT